MIELLWSRGAFVECDSDYLVGKVIQCGAFDLAITLVEKGA